MKLTLAMTLVRLFVWLLLAADLQVSTTRLNTVAVASAPSVFYRTEILSRDHKGVDASLSGIVNKDVFYD